MTICSAIKQHVEPAIQDNLPWSISGFTFEKLGFGDAPFQIRGIKHASLYAGAFAARVMSQHVLLSRIQLPLASHFLFTT
jgi:hypothetical protein